MHRLRFNGNGYGDKHYFQQYFSYPVAVSFIGEGNRSTLKKPPPTAISHLQTFLHTVVSSTPFTTTSAPWDSVHVYAYDKYVKPELDVQFIYIVPK